MVLYESFDRLKLVSQDNECKDLIVKILFKHSPPGDEIRKHSDKNSSRGKKGGKGVIVPDHPSPFSFQIEVLV